VRNLPTSFSLDDVAQRHGRCLPTRSAAKMPAADNNSGLAEEYAMGDKGGKKDKDKAKKQKDKKQKEAAKAKKDKQPKKDK
jgi:hypothetical protein